MNAIFAAIMGLVQGLSEFLPISSSGHLILAEKLLGLLLPAGGLHHRLLCDAAHWAPCWPWQLCSGRTGCTCCAIPSRTPPCCCCSSLLPALAVKILPGDAIDGLFTGWFLGISFLITALFLVLIEVFDRRGRHRARKQEPDVPTALIMGGFQGIALLPGVSRSGSTLLGGIVSGLNRRAAARFSFMMSAPAILGSFLVEGKDAVEQHGLSSLFSVSSLIGLVFAAIAGYLAIRYMLKLIERISFYRFAVYVALVGVAVIIMQVTGFAGFPPIAFPGGGVG